MAKLTPRQKIIFAAGINSSSAGSPGGEGGGTGTSPDETIFRATTDGAVRITTNNSERVTTGSIT